MQIDGDLDLTGDDSAAYSAGGRRVPGAGGAGGYGGGVGASKNGEAQAGEGAAPGMPNRGGKFTGNTFLIPLVGGSGGGGTDASSGGGGGGALLITSSSSIAINGTINANGGNQSAAGFPATGGSGDAIRLAAPAISGAGGTITARGGVASGGEFAGGDGRVRIEAFENTLTANFNGTPISIGKPFKVLLPPEPRPSARIVDIAGIPAGDLTTDSAINMVSGAFTGPRTIRIEARNLAPGIRLKLRLFSESSADVSVLSTSLSGSKELSQATAQLAIPEGTTYLFLSVEPAANDQN